MIKWLPMTNCSLTISDQSSKSEIWSPLYIHVCMHSNCYCNTDANVHNTYIYLHSLKLSLFPDDFFPSDIDFSKFFRCEEESDDTPIPRYGYTNIYLYTCILSVHIHSLICIYEYIYIYTHMFLYILI
jgi:hypothetical protein